MRFYSKKGVWIMPFMYSLPAVLYGGLVATIGASVGFGGFRWEAWIYLILLIAAAVMLSMKKWWGCISGMTVGGIVIYLFQTTSAHQHVNVIPLGIGIIFYYAAMGLICYKLYKKK